jgi:hypothetical protein
LSEDADDESLGGCPFTRLFEILKAKFQGLRKKPAAVDPS